MNMDNVIAKANETAKELENLQKQYEEALDAGNEHLAQSIQRKIDAIYSHM